MKNANYPAMPQSVTYGPDGGVIASYDFAGGAGLTKREHFAAMAMQGYIARGTGLLKEQAAEMAVMAADALLAELEKTS